MENCTIYSHQLDFEKVVNIVKRELPKAQVDIKDGGKQKALTATIKGGFFGKTKTLKVNYRERTNPSYNLDQVDCPLTQNLAGMINFIQNFPAKDENIKNKLLFKVRSVNCEMPFVAEPEITSEFRKVLLKINAALDAIVFAQPNSVFQKSRSNHFTDKNLDLILDQEGNSGLTDLAVNVDAKYHDGPQENNTEEQETRKSKTNAFLVEKNIKQSKTLPCIADARNVEIRSFENISNRIFALTAVAVKGEGIEQKHLDRFIEDKRISSFTEKEKVILQKEVLDDQEKAIATWRYESLNALMWAAGLMPELKFPSDICNVQEIVGLIQTRSRDELEASMYIRSKEEILDELDKVYRMNWACVDARIKGEQVSGGIHPGIVYERHYALNWLTQYQNQDWDNVQTNT